MVNDKKSREQAIGSVYFYLNRKNLNLLDG